MAEEKKGDEFIFVLIAGLIMIVVMLFLWGTPPEIEENISEVSENVSGVFVIGVESQEVPRYIRLGDFSVSYSVGSDVVAKKTNVEIKNGLVSDESFKMSASIDKDMNVVTGGFITIDILDTNSLGRLIVKLNNEVVFNQVVQPGRTDILLEKRLLKNYNVLEFETSGSGFRFWTSSFYEFDNIDFGVNFYGNLEKRLSFEVYEQELRKFKSGEIDFNVENQEGNGVLLIEINNHRIYEGRPSIEFNQEFDLFDVGLIKGQNTITFSTERDTGYDIDDAEIIIIHEETGSKSRSVTFEISDSDYQKLKSGKKGEISFYILDSSYKGPLLVSIIDADGSKHPTEAVDSYVVGELKKIKFDEIYVSTGTNRVVFSVSGEGSFTLSNVEINV